MSNAGFDYDVLVIGCGSAGSKAAATADALGAKVLAVDSAEEMGGLCILRGCMPTKTLLETAHRLHEIRDAERFGIQVAEPTLDFPAHMERMRQLRARFQRAKVGSIERANYELRRDLAHFTDAHTVRIGDTLVRGKAIVLATGSRVRGLSLAAPEIPGVVTSDAMFELESVPARVAVLGGGAVGLEFAQWLARIGSEVTLLVRSPLLHRSDGEMGQELIKALAEEMEVCSPSELLDVSTSESGAARVKFRCGSEEPREIEVDLILNATGRVPNLPGSDLDTLGIGRDEIGSLPPTLQTTVPHVFCAGDATGRRLILHDANLEGAVAGRNAAIVAGVIEGELGTLDPGVPPMDVTFTDPPFASVGATKQQLERDGVAFEEATKRFPEQGRGIVMGARYGTLRLLAEPGKSGKLLGCQILGARADDLIHIPAAVLSMGGTVEQMFRMPWYHPTLAEAFIEVTRSLVNRATNSSSRP